MIYSISIFILVRFLICLFPYTGSLWLPAVIIPLAAIKDWARDTSSRAATASCGARLWRRTTTFTHPQDGLRRGWYIQCKRDWFLLVGLSIHDPFMLQKAEISGIRINCTSPDGRLKVSSVHMVLKCFPCVGKNFQFRSKVKLMIAHLTYPNHIP